MLVIAKYNVGQKYRGKQCHVGGAHVEIEAQHYMYPLGAGRSLLIASHPTPSKEYAVGAYTGAPLPVHELVYVHICIIR